MRCSQVQRLSTAYLDGELDGDRSSAVRGHLRGCNHCAAMFDDEVAIRSATSRLDDQIDPPDTLWSKITAEVAAAEIRDAGRSPIALGWRRLRSALSPYRLHLFAGVIAAAALVALLIKGDRAEVTAGLAPVEVTSMAPPLFAPSGNPPPTHYEQIALEIGRADHRYEATVTELRDLVAGARDSWTAAEARRFDRAIARFDASVAETRRDLERRIAHDPRQRDSLYEMYREHIAFLEGALWGKL